MRDRVIKMKIKAKACEFPTNSVIVAESKSANFHDSYTVTTDNAKLDVLEIYLLMVNNVPKWINFLLSLRNNFVSLFGLKNVGNLIGKNPLQSISRDKIIGIR